MSDEQEFQHGLLTAIPRLRAFAIGLCGATGLADDLVQETLLRAWANRSSFQLGTNMMGWLYVILRNGFYAEFRKRKHEVADIDGQHAATMVTAPAQEGHIEFGEFRAALLKLPPDQREALLLVGSSGMSYEEAATICQCAVGTMKSRVSRARTRLAALLVAEPPERGEATTKSAAEQRTAEAALRSAAAE